MSNRHKPTAEQVEARERLRELLPKGTKVYTILRHVSQNGMSRDISPVLITNDQPWDFSYLVAKAGIYPRSRRQNGDGVRIGGAGMDMGFALVYDLAQFLHNDGYSLSQSWL